METNWDGNVPLTRHTTNEPMDGTNGLTSTNRAMREEILHRARAIWEQRGRPVGMDLSIWLEAETQILSGTRTKHPAG
jgi:hypothetical protein